MTELVARVQRLLGPAWRQILSYLRDQNQLVDVAARIAAGDAAGAIAGIAEAAEHFANEVGAAWKVAARETMGWVGRDAEQLMNFDETNVNAVRAVAEGRLDVLRNVTEDQRAMVRGVLEDGLARGENPRTIARTLRACIGLTDGQAEYVVNFQHELEEGRYADALARQLVDGRNAKRLERLARDGGELDGDQVAAMVDAYADNWVNWRAETIARTEGLRAAHAGSLVGLRQAAESGKVDGEAFKRTWRHKNRGKFQREFHVSMDGDTVTGLDTPFTSGLGNRLMFPCDPDARPEETINCMCVVVTRYRPRVGRLQVAGVSRGALQAGRASGL